MLLTSIFEIYVENGRRKSRLKVVHKMLDLIAHFPQDDRVRHVKVRKLQQRGFRVSPDSHLYKLLRRIGFQEEEKLSATYPFVPD